MGVIPGVRQLDFVQLAARRGSACTDLDQDDRRLATMCRCRAVYRPVLRRDFGQRRPGGRVDQYWTS